MIVTDGWVLHARPADEKRPVAVEDVLRRETFSFSEPDEDEVLVEPLYGSWEANLDHALSRNPVDVCRLRNEESVIIGNLGVVRVLRPGSPSRTSLREGDVCMVMPFGKSDRYGYAELVYAYDMPGTVGILAKRTKIRADVLLPVPEETRHSLPQWAAYARYFTAWDNWNIAYQCWSAQMREEEPGDHLVFGWGGGVSLAELELARRAGFRVAMTASTEERLAHLRRKGIQPVDRRLFPDLAEGGRGGRPSAIADRRYRASEREFLNVIADLSDGAGVAMFIDNIGAPLYKATLKSLARQGVLTTVGWKHGMTTMNRRASECIQRHLHVNTHVWRFQDSATIRDYQESTGWIAEIDPDAIYGFDEIPELAQDYQMGKLSTYFPIYRVNPE
ncbi:zinc-binding dehydrogenase [Actinomadura cremea]|nr:zinc-binding dehydrogenase [Actinomadura cremea]